MIVGFTGPRTGINGVQRTGLVQALGSLDTTLAYHFIHGGATGADAQFHACLIDFFCGCSKHQKSRLELSIYPSDLAEYVAPNLDTVDLGIQVAIHRPQRPLTRNIEMARQINILWATPSSRLFTRSGTWHMINQTKRLVKPVKFFWPD